MQMWIAMRVANDAMNDQAEEHVSWSVDEALVKGVDMVILVAVGVVAAVVAMKEMIDVVLPGPHVLTYHLQIEGLDKSHTHHCCPRVAHHLQLQPAAVAVAVAELVAAVVLVVVVAVVVAAAVAVVLDAH